ncbi:MAG: TetR/AcrR family transcriptional regulator [Gemmataceae bacterium]|nr:TetR/AcrR family transcriptional regulator [Gemmataceae bacterium]
MRTKTPFLEDRILEEAGRLFGARRFHEVRMEDIAGQARVSKGTLYRYFRDKEELYLALLTRAARQMVAELKRRVESTQGARQQLVGIVAAFLGYFDARPHLADLIQRAEVHHEEGGAFPWQEVRDAARKLVVEVFARGKQQGEFCVRAPGQAALMLLGGLRAVVRFGDRPRPRQLPRALVADFLGGASQSVLAVSPEERNGWHARARTGHSG